MSEITIKRRITHFVRLRSTQRGLSATRPSTLKILVPIFTGPWRDKPPGYGQLDTVAHCGSTLGGDYAFTLNYTDIATTWSEQYAQWGKGGYRTKKSIEQIQKYLPFDLLGLYPDSGSEFLNMIVIPWCKEHHVELTRSRPSHKNDNQFIEERNCHIVRKYTGYERLDTLESVDALNDLYRTLSLYLNHFVPIRKCIRKERIGSKYKRIYDVPKTPYQRVMEHSDISQEKKSHLRVIHQSLNLVELKQQVDEKMKALYDLKKRYSNIK